MVQIIVQGLGHRASHCLEFSQDDSLDCLYQQVSQLCLDDKECHGCCDSQQQQEEEKELFFLQTEGGEQIERHSSKRIGDLLSSTQHTTTTTASDADTTSSFLVLDIVFPLEGGIDFQNREGAKTGSGGQLSESQAALERKERLRKLALETIDITKDPYFLKNHLGTFECKLCLTLHPNEGNYLAHTQGKRHQYNLGRRAAMEAKNAAPKTIDLEQVPVQQKRVIKIGRPGYKVSKSRDLITRQRSITFEVEYPEIEEGNQPRHRFMSSYEQKVEVPDKNYQYVLFACDPYETIAFKIPNHAIDKREGRFFTNWDKDNKRFVLQLYFVDGAVNVPGASNQTAAITN